MLAAYAARRGRFSRTRHPRLVGGSDAQLLAKAAAQHSDAGAALQDLQSAVRRVQEAPVDEEGRAQPRPVVFPVPADFGDFH